MYQEQGLVNGTYRGLGAACLRESVYRTLALGLYEPFKRVLHGDGPPEKMPTWKKFAAGAMAGAVGSTAGNPLDILKVKLQASPVGETHNLRWYAKDIYYNQGGVMGFYRGLIPCVTRAVILNAIYMGNYDTVKHKLINGKYMKDGIPCQFTASVITGLMIVLATSPFDNIKTRVYNVKNSLEQGLEYTGMTDCAKKMF